MTGNQMTSYDRVVEQRCEAFADLIRLYYAENANPAVCPPLPKDYQGNKTEKVMAL